MVDLDLNTKEDKSALLPANPGFSAKLLKHDQFRNTAAHSSFQVSLSWDSEQYPENNELLLCFQVTIIPGEALPLATSWKEVLIPWCGIQI